MFREEFIIMSIRAILGGTALVCSLLGSPVLADEYPRSLTDRAYDRFGPAESDRLRYDAMPRRYAERRYVRPRPHDGGRRFAYRDVHEERPAYRPVYRAARVRRHHVSTAFYSAPESVHADPCAGAFTHGFVDYGEACGGLHSGYAFGGYRVLPARPVIYNRPPCLCD